VFEKKSLDPISEAILDFGLNNGWSNFY